MSGFIKKLTLTKILLAALSIRILLIPLSFHGDLNNNAFWGMYAEEFGLRGFYDWLNFRDHARPDYPPLAMIMFFLIRVLWRIIFNFLWTLNVNISLFPSNLIPWFEKEGYLSLIKLPGVFCDLGIGYIIFKYLKGVKSESTAKIYSSLFLFNPAVIYLSASWGQLESIVGFFGLVSALLIIKLKYISSFLSFFISVMIKVTMLPSSIILLGSALKTRIGKREVLTIGATFLGLMLVINYIFIGVRPVSWLIFTYVKKFIPGAVTLPFINLNAFNFWGILFGLSPYLDSKLFLGISLYYWAWTIAVAFFALVFYKFIKGSEIFFSLLILFFAAFMFMPRVHERYLYPVFVFFPIVLAYRKNLLRYFYLLSAIFFINLYHFWWFPRVNYLVYFLDLEIVERLLSVVNLTLFVLVLKNFLAEKNSLVKSKLR